MSTHEWALRRPSVAGKYYPANSTTLQAMVRSYLDAAPAPDLSDIRAVIAPHAGYPYSGPVAGHCFKTLAHLPAGRYTVYLLGPAHYVPVEGVGLGRFGAFDTPLGSVPVATDRVEELIDRGYPYQQANDAHLPEHCLEVELPFLKVVLPDFQIVPMLLGEVDPLSVGADLVELVKDDPRALVVVSSDLSHYHPYEVAQQMDQTLLRSIVEGDIHRAARGEACGLLPILAIMALAQQHHWQATLLDYRNSGDTSGDKRSVVGYGAIAYTA